MPQNWESAFAGGWGGDTPWHLGYKHWYSPGKSWKWKGLNIIIVVTRAATIIITITRSFWLHSLYSWLFLFLWDAWESSLKGRGTPVPLSMAWDRRGWIKASIGWGRTRRQSLMFRAWITRRTIVPSAESQKEEQIWGDEDGREVWVWVQMCRVLRIQTGKLVKMFSCLVTYNEDEFRAEF